MMYNNLKSNYVGVSPKFTFKYTKKMCINSSSIEVVTTILGFKWFSCGSLVRITFENKNYSFKIFMFFSNLGLMIFIK